MAVATNHLQTPEAQPSQATMSSPFSKTDLLLFPPAYLPNLVMVAKGALQPVPMNIQALVNENQAADAISEKQLAEKEIYSLSVHDIYKKGKSQSNGITTLLIPKNISPIMIQDAANSSVAVTGVFKLASSGTQTTENKDFENLPPLIAIVIKGYCPGQEDLKTGVLLVPSRTSVEIRDAQGTTKLVVNMEGKITQTCPPPRLIKPASSPKTVPTA